MTMKKILVPTDFSNYANNALNVAFSLARKNNAQIDLLNSIPPSSYMAVIDENNYYPAQWQDLEKELREKSIEKLNKIVTNTHYKGVSINPVHTTGYVSESIVEHATDNNIDLIVMGTKGASGLKEVLIGSNTERVVRQSNCPVLSISEYENDFIVNKICYASSFEEETGDKFQIVKTIADVYDADIQLLRINTPNDFKSTIEINTAMEEFAVRWKLKNYELVTYNDYFKEEGLSRYLSENPIDLLAMGTHKRKGLQHLLLGSIAEDVVNHSHVSVLTFKI